jgi:7-keto-8-aminopelargonate synthetase-like enzyme
MKKVVDYTLPLIDDFSDSRLMHSLIDKREETHLLLANGCQVIDFVNCSYFGLEIEPAIIQGAQQALADWGVHFTCARTRFSIKINQQLEEKLSQLFKGKAITFPSVSSAHASVLPLIAAGLLFPTAKPVTFIFDKCAHASMQFLKPILAEEAEIVTIPHNCISSLEREIGSAHLAGRSPVYVADGLYSMGGAAPMEDIIRLSQEKDVFFYLDDAHGTSLYGEKGEGFVMSHFSTLPENMVVTYSLAKGFGCNGGGVLLPTLQTEKHVRFFGQTYSFSAPLDFSVIGAALVSADYHANGQVKEMQAILRKKVALFREAMGLPSQNYFSPIQMIDLPDILTCKTLALELLEKGFFVATVFFPVVAKGKAQFRIAITIRHTEEQLIALASAIKAGLKS